MAVVKACKILIAGANWGLGLEMIKQLSENSCPKQHSFATLKKGRYYNVPSLMFVLLLSDSDDPSSVKESAKKVGSLLGNNGLNLLMNNTSSVEDMKNTNTNVIGPLLITRVMRQMAAKTSGIPGISSNKAAVINISTVAGSMTRMLVQPIPNIAIWSEQGFNMLTVLAAEGFKADEILCMALHPEWVKTELGGDEATLEPKESVEGMLRVIGSLTKKQQGGFMDYTGETVTW
uniref:C-factor n=1 Tax=Sinocyclocheilus grahami TaxID=75366 RepID=A0A672P460_SINGR